MIKKFVATNKYFILVISLLHLFFFGLTLHFKHIYNGDSFEYIYEAENIRHLFFFYSGNPALPIDIAYMTQRMPLYPMFIMMFYFIHANNWIIILFQNIISILNVLVARKILIDLGFNKKYDWLLLVFILACPSQFIHTDTICPDTILQSSVLLYIISWKYLFKTGHRKFEFFAGLALIAGMMIKPVVYPLVFVHLVAVIAYDLKRKVLLQRTTAFAAMPIIFALLFSFWNMQRTGKFHFTSNVAFNAIYYYEPYMSHRFGEDSARKWLTQTRKEISYAGDFPARYDAAVATGQRTIGHDYLHYGLYHLANALRIFVEPGKAEIDLFTGKLSYGGLYGRSRTSKGFFATMKEDGMAGMATYVADNPVVLIVFLIFVFNCIKLWGLILFLRCRSIERNIRILFVLILLYFALAAGPIANTRYFLPVALLYTITGAAGLTVKKRIQAFV